MDTINTLSLVKELLIVIMLFVFITIWLCALLIYLYKNTELKGHTIQQINSHKRELRMMEKELVEPIT